MPTLLVSLVPSSSRPATSPLPQNSGSGLARKDPRTPAPPLGTAGGSRQGEQLVGAEVLEGLWAPPSKPCQVGWTGPGWVKEGEHSAHSSTLPKPSGESQPLSSGPAPFQSRPPAHKGHSNERQIFGLGDGPSQRSGLRWLLPGPHLGTNWVSLRGLNIYLCCEGNAQPRGAWTGSQDAEADARWGVWRTGSPGWQPAPSQ